MVSLARNPAEWQRRQPSHGDPCSFLATLLEEAQDEGRHSALDCVRGQSAVPRLDEWHHADYEDEVMQSKERHFFEQ